MATPRLRRLARRPRLLPPARLPDDGRAGARLLGVPTTARPLDALLARPPRRRGPARRPLAPELPRPPARDRLARVARPAVRPGPADRVRRRQPLGPARMPGPAVVGPLADVPPPRVGPRAAGRRDAPGLVRPPSGPTLRLLAPGPADLRPGAVHPLRRPRLPGPARPRSRGPPPPVRPGRRGRDGRLLGPPAPRPGLCPGPQGRLACRRPRHPVAEPGWRDDPRLLRGPAMDPRGRGRPLLPRPRLRRPARRPGARRGRPRPADLALGRPPARPARRRDPAVPDGAGRRRPRLPRAAPGRPPQRLDSPAGSARASRSDWNSVRARPSACCVAAPTPFIRAE